MLRDNRPAVLFDLDGTMTDPFEGITRSIQYALEKLGRIAPAADDLRWCIGPPLTEAFKALLETEDANAIGRAILLYRERYIAVGKFENRVIDGIPQTLETLADTGYRLIVATSKPRSYTLDILDHFDLARHFDAVHGSELDGRNSEKTDLIRHIIRQEAVEPATAIMIGDRLHDIVGANANKVASIGVLWGYGDRAELEGAGADRIAERPEDLPAHVENMNAAVAG
ncbi:HAD hydrolase-like protein [Mesorhizobium koreense]|jgi:phosphoglycolate phosphatase|uniref:HAD hydrolase-like protein n=1 Tax=Mesorhizobium koreense TaxID=3074855 RepID=UPI00287B5C90|nr:HAD hydrolase-like protein [Mesorhizobium sp. WR6]